MQASRVRYIDDAIAADPSDHDHIIEREFVDEICEAHAKPGEVVYNSSHDMDLSGDQGCWFIPFVQMIVIINILRNPKTILTIMC